jgi:hypothetical protein
MNGLEKVLREIKRGKERNKKGKRREGK